MAKWRYFHRIKYHAMNYKNNIIPKQYKYKYKILLKPNRLLSNHLFLANRLEALSSL